jgi:hypothetical protein
MDPDAPDALTYPLKLTAAVLAVVALLKLLHLLGVI